MSYSSQLSLFDDFPKPSTSQQPDQKLTGGGVSASIQDPSDWDRPANSSTATPPSKQNRSYHFQAIVASENENVSTDDLDETLKFSPSLAKGVEFNDEEAWESFSHGSPRSQHRTESSGSDVTLLHFSPSTQDSVWKSPVRKEVLAENVGLQTHHPTVDGPDTRDAIHNSGIGKEQGQRLTTSIAEKCKVLEMSSPTRYTPNNAPHAKDVRSLTQVAPEFSNSVGELFVPPPPPPPSALVSKLFPVLRQVEEPRKALASHQPPKPHPSSDCHAPLSVESTSPVSSMEGDSGIRSLSSASVALSEELKYKLNQLEEEIVKYRAENASLEKLRKEREDVSVQVILQYGVPTLPNVNCV